MNARFVHEHIETIAIAALLVGAGSIAFAPIFVRLSEAGPVATAFYRCLLALPALGLWMGWERRKLRQSSPDGAQNVTGRPRGFAYLWLAGAFFAGDLGVWHFSINLTSVANATLLPNMAPLFVTLVGFLLFGERFSKTFIIGMLFAIGGAVILMGDSLSLSADHFLGDVLGVTVAGFYAGYILTVGRLRARYTTATLMFWSTLATTVCLLPAVFVAGESFSVVSTRGWAILVGLALVTQVMGQGLIAYALAHLPAAFGAVSLLFQPALAAFLAWILFAESLGLWQGVGAVVILFGIVLARRGSRSGPRKAA